MRLRLHAVADMQVSSHVSTLTQVGNAYTYGSNTIGSLVKIGSDPAGCGGTGTFSTGSSPKAFTSTVHVSDIYSTVASGYQNLLDTLRGSANPATFPVPTLQTAIVDSCVKRFESLAVQARLPLLCGASHGPAAKRPPSLAPDPLLFAAGTDHCSCVAHEQQCGSSALCAC